MWILEDKIQSTTELKCNSRAWGWFDDHPGFCWTIRSTPSVKVPDKDSQGFTYIGALDPHGNLVVHDCRSSHSTMIRKHSGRTKSLLETASFIKKLQDMHDTCQQNEGIKQERRIIQKTVAPSQESRDLLNPDDRCVEAKRRVPFGAGDESSGKISRTQREQVWQAEGKIRRG